MLSKKEFNKIFKSEFASYLTECGFARQKYDFIRECDMKTDMVHIVVIRDYRFEIFLSVTFPILKYPNPDISYCLTDQRFGESDSEESMDEIAEILLSKFQEIGKKWFDQFCTYESSLNYLKKHESCSGHRRPDYHQFLLPSLLIKTGRTDEAFGYLVENYNLKKEEYANSIFYNLDSKWLMKELDKDYNDFIIENDLQFLYEKLNMKNLKKSKRIIIR